MSATTPDLLSNGQRYYLPVYRPREVILERGQGARVWDSEGREYLDLSAGIAVEWRGLTRANTGTARSARWESRA